MVLIGNFPSSSTLVFKPNSNSNVSYYSYDVGTVKNRSKTWVELNFLELTDIFPVSNDSLPSLYVSDFEINLCFGTWSNHSESTDSLSAASLRDFAKLARFLLLSSGVVYSTTPYFTESIVSVDIVPGA